MIREFSIHNTSTGAITFLPVGLNNSNLRFLVTYDSSTGEITPSDYLVWRTLSSDTTKVVIDSTYIYPKQIQSSLSLDYTTLLEKNFVIMTSYEFSVLTLLLQKIDSVRSKYPNSFPKKFSLEEMVTCIEASLADINLYPSYTGYWFRFNTIKEEDVNSNPFMNDMNNGVPYTWLEMVVMGALLNLLVMQGILETDINFSASDQGVSITYQNAEGIRAWYTTLIETYEKRKKLAKAFIVPPQAVGTYPFGSGLPALIGTAMGSAAQAGYAWWQAYAGRSG